jgi:transposase-like protein
VAVAALDRIWGQRCPAIIGLWRSAWEQFTPFLVFPPEVRRSSTRPTRVAERPVPAGDQALWSLPQ